MRFANALRRYLPLLVALDIALALAVGWLLPAVKAAAVMIPFFLFVMLYPMMINVRIEDLGRALKNPKLLLVALTMNFLVTPLLGALWAYVIFRQADPYLLAGFILKVTVPGSGMVAAWTGYARGKVESALVIVAWCYLVGIFMIPMWMWILAGAYVPINPLLILKTVLLIVALPLAAGLTTRKVLVRKMGIDTYKKMAPLFPAISTCGMLLMVFVIISNQAELIVGNFSWMLLVILGIATLYPILFALAIIASRVLRITHEHCMALGYSVTAKNHAITIGLATTAFSGTLAVLPAAVAPVIQIPVMLLFLFMTNRIERFLHPASGVVEVDSGGNPDEKD